VWFEYYCLPYERGGRFHECSMARLLFSKTLRVYFWKYSIVLILNVDGGFIAKTKDGAGRGRPKSSSPERMTADLRFYNKRHHRRNRGKRISTTWIKSEKESLLITIFVFSNPIYAGVSSALNLIKIKESSGCIKGGILLTAHILCKTSFSFRRKMRTLIKSGQP